ncbi:MAG: hypothetical protein ACP5OG_06265 [Candidatus Nanoarchaeia archaeon]
MKQKLSISIDTEKIKLINEMLKQDRFRSKSHVIEYILSKFLNENSSDLNLGETENGKR